MMLAPEGRAGVSVCLLQQLKAESSEVLSWLVTDPLDITLQFFVLTTAVNADVFNGIR